MGRLCKEHLGLDLYRASFIECNNADDSDIKDADFEEFPWWFWGIDYEENEMKQLKRIVLHRNIVKKDDGNDATKITSIDIDKKKKSATTTTFRTCQEFLDSFDELT